MFRVEEWDISATEAEVGQRPNWLVSGLYDEGHRMAGSSGRRRTIPGVGRTAANARSGRLFKPVTGTPPPHHRIGERSTVPVNIAAGE
jgi:hypothetical protein